MGARSELVTWSGDLTRPVPLGAAAVLALNDHVLKGAGVVPAALTGKLSDVAGLLAGGIAAVCLARGAAAAVTGRVPRRDGRLAVAALIAVGLGFAALKLWPAFNAGVARVWGVNVLDPSDLWALPMLAVAWLWLRDRESGASRAVPRRFVSGLALGAVLLVCAATPAPPPVPPQPAPGWVIEAGTLELPCGVAEAWVSKAGRTGAGLTIRVTRNREAEPCDVAIDAAKITFRDRSFPGREIPLTAPPPPPERRVYDAREVELERMSWRYVAFEFDSLARWNRGDRVAAFQLELTVAGAPQHWLMSARHILVSFPLGPNARRYY